MQEKIVRNCVAPYAPRHEARIKIYPMGGYEIMACNRPVFAEYPAQTKRKKKPEEPNRANRTDEKKGLRSSDSVSRDERSMRRARSRVREIALSNKFRWFVTLTLDQSKIDRYDMTAIIKVLNSWLNNRVKRNGLSYVIVPELHKDGAIHFHGLFSDCLTYSSSGHSDAAGHPVYNLKDWTLGFSSAIEIYGDYQKAVSYVCKYIGKGVSKIGGRWYYSGGKLEKPTIIYPDLTITELNLSHPDAYMFQVPETGAYFSIVRGNSMDELTFSSL